MKPIAPVLALVLSLCAGHALAASNQADQGSPSAEQNADDKAAGTAANSEKTKKTPPPMKSVEDAVKDRLKGKSQGQAGDMAKRLNW